MIRTATPGPSCCPSGGEREGRKSASSMTRSTDGLVVARMAARWTRSRWTPNRVSHHTLPNRRHRWCIFRPKRAFEESDRSQPRPRHPMPVRSTYGHAPGATSRPTGLGRHRQQRHVVAVRGRPPRLARQGRRRMAVFGCRTDGALGCSRRAIQRGGEARPHEEHPTGVRIRRPRCNRGSVDVDYMGAVVAAKARRSGRPGGCVRSPGCPVARRSTSERPAPVPQYRALLMGRRGRLPRHDPRRDQSQDRDSPSRDSTTRALRRLL